MKILISLIFVIVITGCSDHSRDDMTPTIKICDIEAMKGYKYSNFINYEKTIYLDSQVDCYIGSIDKILLSGDRIYILDKFITKSLFVFDLNGNFRFKICSRGKGPGEYNTPVDFDIESNLIWIQAASPRKLLAFNLNGVFVKELVLQALVPASLMAVINDKIVQYAQSFPIITESGQVSYYRYAVFDSKGRLIEKFLKVGENDYRGNDLHNKAQLHKINGKVILTLPTSDKIYSYSNGNFNKEFIVDFGKNRIPDNFFSGNPENQYESLFHTDYAHSITNTFYSNDIIFFEYTQSNRVYTYCRITKNNITFLSSGLTDDIYYVFPRIVSFSENRFIAYTTKEDLENNLELGKKQGWIPADTTIAERILGRLDQNANPVLFLLKIN